MMGMKRPKQEDIAKALGVSRITVSKALSGSQNISDAMREQVLAKAKEMGYTKYVNRDALPRTDSVPPDGAQGSGRRIISLLTYMYCTTDSYWAPVISGIASILAPQGFDLSLCFLSMKDRESFIYPNNFDPKNTQGIILMGNFTYCHVQKIKQLNIPLISIDTVPEYEEIGLLADTIMSCNKQPMAYVTARLIGQGHRKIGYVGQTHLSLTFKERWNGFCMAMQRAELPLDAACCVLMESGQSYGEKDLMQRLRRLKKWPSAFVCSNDETAILLIRCLRTMADAAPGPIAVSGFDNLSEAQLLDLTTVNVCKVEMGMRAAEEMLWRIHNPDRPFEMIRIQAQPVYRKSTEIVLTGEE